jgi:F-type H+-transporting ATPase subunit delta
MIPSEVSRRYARALLEIGREQGSLEALTNELSLAASVYEGSSELKSALENPLVALAAKRNILADIADAISASSTAKHTLLLLADRRRVRALPAIARTLRELADTQKGIVRAEVTAARPLSAEQSEKLRAQLERITGKQIAIDTRVDASLLAGVVTRIGDTIYDGSLRGRMAQLRGQLVSN